MKVLILTIWYPNSENPILGTFVHEQADALRDSGVDIRIVQPLPHTPFPVSLLKESYRRLAAIPAKEVYQGFDVYHPRYITLPKHLFFERVGEWMYRAIQPVLTRLHASWPFDIIHAHATYPCGYAANRVRDADLPSVKVVHTVHGTDIRDAPTYNDKCLENVCSALEGADRDVFVSLEGKRLATQYTGGRCDNRSEYITNGVSTKKFHLNDSDRAELEQLKSTYCDSWNLVFVGNVSATKGIKELLSATANLRKKGRDRLRVFLIGHNRLGTYITDFLKTAKLEGMVQLVGPVAHDRVKIWMNFADAFILPSHFEGLPTVLFEALYAGAPSIFTRVGGVGDVVEDGVNALLIDPLSVPAIEQAVSRLMDSPELCRSLSEQGKRRIENDFTWEINARRQIALYKNLLANCANGEAGGW